MFFHVSILNRHFFRSGKKMRRPAMGLFISAHTGVGFRNEKFDAFHEIRTNHGFFGRGQALGREIIDYLHAELVIFRGFW